MTMRTENFENFIQGMKKRTCDGSSNSPVQLMLGLTNVCNLHCAFCPYCGFCMRKTEQPEEIPLNIVEELAPYMENARFINPSGRGEPLLYRNFKNFLEICRDHDGLQVMQLINNGTQLHRFSPEMLRDINVICISVDSVNKETFELLRCGAHFEQVMENITNLRSSLPSAVLQWNVVVNRLNIAELYDIFCTAREIGINYISFNDVYGFEEDRTIQLLRLRKSDYAAVERQLHRINEANKDSQMFVGNLISYDGFEDQIPCDTEAIRQELLQLKSLPPYLDFDEINSEDTKSREINIRDGQRFNPDKFALPYCTAPFSTMMIYPNLTVAPCCADFGALDSARGKGVHGVWCGKHFKKLRYAMFHYDFIPDFCKGCSSFARYEYINEYIEALKQDKDYTIEQLTIPPRFTPPKAWSRIRRSLPKSAA